MLENPGIGDPRRQRSSMSEPLHFVCLKWGSKYPASYVNRLSRMVRRNFGLPMDFHCLTEDPGGLDPEIGHLPLQTSDLRGFWYKLMLFQRDFFGLQGDILFLDLDVVIVGNIDFLAELPGDFLIIRDWSRNRMWNSSVMRFKAGRYDFIWERFVAQKQHILASYNGDQEWIHACVPEAANWPADRILSYKKSLNSRAFPLLDRLGARRLGLKTPDRMDTPLPPDAAIIVFHGKPDPEDVAEHAYGPWKRASFIQRHWR